MLFLKAETTEGKTEYFNTQNILSMQPQGQCNEYLKILMGAGLYWTVYKDTVEIVDLQNIFNGE